MAAARRRGDVDEAIEIFLRLWTDGPRRSPQQVASTVRERVRAMARQTLAHPPAGGTPEPVAPPAIARLAEVRVPTLIVVGDQDWPNILAAADLLAGYITDARKVVMPQAAHMVSMERPEEFNRAVLDFLDKPYRYRHASNEAGWQILAIKRRQYE
jgi:pimeloyl-ACP methyl ester carboxylesterase